MAEPYLWCYGGISRSLPIGGSNTLLDLICSFPGACVFTSNHYSQWVSASSSFMIYNDQLVEDGVGRRWHMADTMMVHIKAVMSQQHLW